MKEMINLITDASDKAGKTGEFLIKELVNVHDFALSDILKIWGFKSFMINKLVAGGLFPLLNKILDIEKLETEKFVEMLNENHTASGLSGYLSGVYNRALSGLRYDYLIKNLGKKFFGSAQFEGEILLEENDYFTLKYIPPQGKERGWNLFHAGGPLPYSDKLFRLTDEVNFFNPFIKHGIGVYAMETKGNIKTNPELERLTLDVLVHTLHRFSGTAFEHNGNKKMVLEGYCGLGMPSVYSFLADRENMKKRFDVIALFVVPINGVECSELSNMINVLPQSVMLMGEIAGFKKNGMVKGENIGSTLDMVTESFLEKTRLGRILNGWKSGAYADIDNGEEVNEKMKADLAGAYWISPDNAALFPMHESFTHFSSRMFSQGISSTGDLPVRYKNNVLNITDIKKSGVKVAAFYGINDPMISPEAADIMKKHLGEDMEHVVHEKTGHISYVFSNNRWNENDKNAFQPGIIETIEKLKNR